MWHAAKRPAARFETHAASHARSSLMRCFCEHGMLATRPAATRAPPTSCERKACEIWPRCFEPSGRACHCSSTWTPTRATTASYAGVAVELFTQSRPVTRPVSVLPRAPLGLLVRLTSIARTGFTQGMGEALCLQGRGRRLCSRELSDCCRSRTRRRAVSLRRGASAAVGVRSIIVGPKVCVWKVC